MAKIMAKTTICSASFLTIASTTLSGTTCSSSAANEGGDAAGSAAAFPPTVATTTPCPGRTTLPVTSPTTSAMVVTTSKYTIDRTASVPTPRRCEPWPAMPTTSVANTSGAMSDLTIRRKSVDTTARSLARKPVAPG
jgi:hypothetical protein